MKETIKGEILIIKRDAQTGEEIERIQDTNHVADFFYQDVCRTGETEPSDLSSSSRDQTFDSGYTTMLRYGMFDTYESGTADRGKVVIGLWDQDYSYDGYVYSPVVGYAETGVSNPRMNNDVYNRAPTGHNYMQWSKPETDPANFMYYEFQNRFDPPTADRVIYTIGLISQANQEYDTRVLCSAWSKLTTPCTQTTTETLDVFYRISFPESDFDPTSGKYLNDPNSINIRHHRMNTRHTWACYRTENMFALPTRVSWYPTAKWVDTLANGSADSPNGQTVVHPGASQLGSSAPYGAPLGGGWGSIDSIYRRQYSMSCDLSQQAGRIMAASSSGSTDSQNDRGTEVANHNYSFHFSKVKRPEVSPIQNLYGHKADAAKPFYDSLEIPVGTGAVEVSGGETWTDPDFPKMYRIEMTNSGLLGSSEYQVWERTNLGFFGNTMEQYPTAIPNINKRNFEWMVSAWNRYLKIDETSLVFMYTTDGAVLMDLIDYDVKGFLRNPDYEQQAAGWPGGGWIMHAEKDENGDIWVATDGNGLFKLSPVDLTILGHYDNTTPGLENVGLTASDWSQPDACACFSVKKGVGNRLWAMFLRQLAYTDDFGVTWHTYDEYGLDNFGGTPTGALIDVKAYTDGDGLGIFTNGGTWDYRYRKFMSMTCDRSHPDHRIMIAYDSYWTTTDYYQRYRVNMYGAWFDTVNGINGTAVPLWINEMHKTRQYTMNNITNWMEDTGSPQGDGSFYFTCYYRSTWSSNSYGGPAWLTYGTSSVTTIPTGNAVLRYAGQNNCEIIEDENGEQWMMSTTDRYEMVLSKPNGTFIKYDTYTGRTYGVNSSDAVYVWRRSMARDNNPMYGLFASCAALFKDSGILITTYNQWYQRITNDWKGDYRPYIVCFGNNSVNGSPLSNYVWRKYGWDGANWVKDHPGSKPTHDTTDPIIDGLTVRFSDNLGANTFAATDYYTVGVLDGVQADGATEFSHLWHFYTLPTDYNQTDLEVATVPATPNDIAPMKTWNYTGDSRFPYFLWESTWSGINTTSRSGSTYYTSGTRLYHTGTFSARSVSEVTGDFTFRVSFGGQQSNVNTYQYHGVTDAATDPFGTTNFVKENIQYGFEFHNPNGIAVIKDGVRVLVDGNEYLHMGTTTSYDMWHDNNKDDRSSFEIRRDGLEIKWYVNTRLVHSFTETTATDKHMLTIGIGYMAQYSYYTFLDRSSDYWVKLGNETNGTGYHQSGFRSIDYYSDSFSFTIDGVETTQIAQNDYTTALTAGQISLFPNDGFVRCSPDDAGKTVAAEYNVCYRST